MTSTIRARFTASARSGSLIGRSNLGRLAALTAALVGISGCAVPSAGPQPPERSYPTNQISVSPADSVAEVQLVLTDGSYQATWIPRTVLAELNQRLSDAEAAGELRNGATLECPRVARFCAFKLSAAGADQPVLFVQPDKVSFTRNNSTFEYSDPEGSSYALIYDAAAKGFDPYTRDLLPAADPNLPVVDASIPPLAGSPASWVLARPKQVNRKSTTLELLVTRFECASGKTGELLEPVVSFGPDAVVIRVDAVPLGGDTQTCQGNDAVPVKLKLAEPVGDRDLIDAICLAEPGASAEPCAKGPVRRQG